MLLPSWLLPCVLFHNQFSTPYQAVPHAEHGLAKDGYEGSGLRWVSGTTRELCLLHHNSPFYSGLSFLLFTDWSRSLSKYAYCQCANRSSVRELSGRYQKLIQCVGLRSPVCLGTGTSSRVHVFSYLGYVPRGVSFLSLSITSFFCTPWVPPLLMVTLPFTLEWATSPQSSLVCWMNPTTLFLFSASSLPVSLLFLTRRMLFLSQRSSPRPRLELPT